MSQRWRVLDLIECSSDITANTGRLLVGEVEVPLSDVACILTGDRTKWSGSMVSMAAKFEVPILACDWRGIPYSMTMPWSSNSRVATRHHAQCDLSIPRAKNAWMRVIRAKILGQAANLPEPNSLRLKELAQAVRSGDPDNLEARAARTYWSTLFPGENFSRDTNGLDRNTLLNYGYTVMRGFVIRAVCTAGLIPSLGIFHRNRSNTFGLADDLIEPFRPAVDYSVAILPRTASLEDKEIKKYLVAIVTGTMGDSGESIGAAINDLAQRFAMYCEGDIPKLPVPVWVAPNG